jgi:DNA-binding NtrC family response regulator
MTRSILIVDDDPRVRRSLARALAENGTQLRVVETAEVALGVLGTARPDVLLTDVRLPGIGGIELLRLVRARAPEVAVVLMTAFDDLELVARAMREGAADFLVKPLDLHRLRQVIGGLLEDRERARARRSAAEEPEGSPPGLVGRDPRMVAIFKVVGQVAAARTHVVIRGESGTGKELIARAIHASSAESALPFVAVNCTALPSTLLESELFGHRRGSFTGATSDRKGRIAQAGEGTLFLDEIGDTSLEFQAKLLRVLQEREYYPVGGDRPERTEARVVAATHRDLERMVERGEFREDLYYRLRVVEVHLPPLRERPGDIPLLAEHLVRKASTALKRMPPLLAEETMAALTCYTWPGNVRELENCLTRAVVLTPGDIIRPDQLGLATMKRVETAALPRRPATLAEAERAHIAAVLQHTAGHKARAARLLGVSRPRLDRLIRKHALDEPDRPDGEGA